MLSQNLSKQLNHQRVRQMLSDHIPEDEAKLLSNGRLTCMICQHRPIFDCVKTLSHHRMGKKHIAELGKYLKCKSEHEYQKLKHTQQKEIESKGTVKPEKSKLKYMKRKMILSPSTLFIDNPESSAKKGLPKVNDFNLVQPSAVKQVKRYLKSIARKKRFEKSLEEAKDSYGVTTSQNCSDFRNTVRETKVSEIKSKSAFIVCSNFESGKAEHELKLKMSGWIKDSTGKWIKNPDVEFDSDEDEPPVMQEC